MNYNKDNGLLNMIRRTDPMIVLLLISVFFFVCCTSYDYKIERMPYIELSYEELPLDVQKHLASKTSFSRFSIDLDTDIVLIDSNDSATYQLEYVETLFGPWELCKKLINVKKNIVYRIERGTPSPYIVHKEKLYVPDEFIYFVDEDYRVAKYNEYTLKWPEDCDHFSK